MAAVYGRTFVLLSIIVINNGGVLTRTALTPFKSKISPYSVHYCCWPNICPHQEWLLFVCILSRPQTRMEKEYSRFDTYSCSIRLWGISSMIVFAPLHERWSLIVWAVSKTQHRTKKGVADMTHKAPPCAGGGTAISLKVIEMSTLLTNNQLEFEKICSLLLFRQTDD